MKFRSSLLLALAAVLHAAPLAGRSVPSTLNYQGRLTDNTPQQNPVNGSIYMRFAIHDAAAGGAPLWQEPAGGGVAVTVSGGIFSVQLGTIVAIPPAVFTGGADRWLEITLNPGAGNEEILAPRQKLAAGGYAVHSGHAAAADSAATAASATSATTAATAGDSLALGGVPASGWQQALDANCGGGGYLTGFAADGTPACSVPSAQPPVPLALSGSAPVPLLTVTQSGAAQAIKGEVTASGSSSVTAVWGQHLAGGFGGYFNTTAGGTGVYAGGVNGYGLYGEATGSGRAGYFRNSAAGNASPALTGQSFGTTGWGVYGEGAGTTGANFGTVGQSYSSQGTGIFGGARNSNAGAGNTTRGVWAQNDSTTGIAHGLYATTAGGGGSAAVYGLSTAGADGVAGYAAGPAGNAGEFGVNAAANPSDALNVFTLGTGSAGSFQINNAANGAAAVDAFTNGTGPAGSFTISNAAGPNSALYAATNGTGRAAWLSSSNAANNNAALYVTTNGVFAAAQLVVSNPVATPLALYGAPGQTGNLQEWRNSGGTIQSRVGPTGIFIGNGSGLSNVSAASVANGVYTSGSYADPAWLSSLAGAKISGAVSDSAALNGIPASGWQQALAANCPGGQYLAGISQNGAPACGTPSAQPSVPLTLNGGDTGPILAASNSGLGGAILGAARGGAAVTARADDPSAVPLVAQGAAGQSVDLQQWRNDAGSSLASVNFAGVFTGNGSALNSLNPAALSPGTAAINISGNAATAGAVSNGVTTTGSYSNPAWITALDGGKISGTVAAATNAAQLGGVAASSYQRTLSPAACPAGQYLSAVAGGGSATCGAPVSLSEPLRVIRGAVASTGAISGGAGFTITHGGTGDYTVNFTTPFLAGSTPAVTFTAHHATLLVFAAAGLTSASSAKVRTYNAAGTLTDENFFFIAAGAP